MAEGLEQEITQLEEKLAEKRRALETAGTPAEQMPSHQEMVHEAVGEKIKEKAPTYQPAPTPKPAPSGSGGASWQDPAIAQQVQSLVNIAFTKSLDEAIGEAVKTENHAIIDAFHDLLRDQLLDELVSRGKLTPVK